jgi:hypothetical protein
MAKDGQSVFFEVWLIISTQQFEQIHFSACLNSFKYV